MDEKKSRLLKNIVELENELSRIMDADDEKYMEIMQSLSDLSHIIYMGE